MTAYVSILYNNIVNAYFQKKMKLQILYIKKAEWRLSREMRNGK